MSRVKENQVKSTKKLKDNEEPLIVLISAMVCTRSLTDSINEIYEEWGHIFDFKVFFVNDVNTGVISSEEFTSSILRCAVLLIDIRGNNPAVEMIVEILSNIEKYDKKAYKRKTIISLVGGNEEIRRLTRMGSFDASKIPSKKTKEIDLESIPDITNFVKKGIRISKNIAKVGKYLPFGSLKHSRNWTLVMDYWVYGHSGIMENHKNMILFILKEYLGQDYLDVPPPLKIPPFGIYDPEINQYFTKLEDYMDAKPFNPEKQSIGLFYYGGIYFEQSIPIIETFMQRLNDFNIIPVYSEVLTNLEAQKQFFFKNGISTVSCVINLQYFQINGGPFGGDNQQTLELYKTMNVPQFNPVINFDMTVTDYLESKQGSSPINQVISVVMPELDGRIEMMNVGCMADLGYSEEISAKVLEITPMKDTIELTCNRVAGWLKLRRKKNAEKKLALILYDYPPGEGNLGNASYLSVSESIQNIVSLLKREGYKVGTLFEKIEDICGFMVDEAIINQPKHVDLKNFKGFVIGGKEYSNIFQDLPEKLQNEILETWGEPPGGIMTREGNILLPLLESGNLLIGLQPARGNISTDPTSYHDKAIPPHHQYLAFYRYFENVAEVDAIIHVGTHGTEEFLPGKECLGHISDYPINLLGKIPNIYIYTASNTSESAIAKRRSNAVIINHASPAFKNSDLNQDLTRLENLIRDFEDLNSNIIKKEQGSHEETIDTIKKDISQLAGSLGIEFDTIQELEGKLYRFKMAAIPFGLHIFDKSYTNEEKCDLISEIALHSGAAPPFIDEIINKIQEGNFSAEKKILDYINTIVTNLNESKNFVNEMGLSKSLHVQFSEWVINLKKKMDGTLEGKNLLRALEGGFIEPGYGGDPIRSPELFPTGRNSYGFDPRLIPSATAYRRGHEIAAQLLEKYKLENGEWPETVSVVLWAFETMKTGGETIGQIFNYLGVRAVKHKSIWTTELEVIPLEEMAHPRINVITTICGIFRDTFPYILDIINQAIELVANLDESPEVNYLKKSINDLKGKGPLASARVFGPPPGKYNTNITNIISAGDWKDEQELAADYIESMGHAYLKNQKIEKAPELFASNVSRIKLMSQIRDGADYHVTDLDHYYEFTGGLAKAKESITGEKTPIFIADTSRKEISVDSLKNSIREGVLTRNLNPSWIQGMIKHKHHGAQKIAERVENLLGMAATSSQVENWTWEKSYEQYIENEEIKDALIENNRYAMMDMITTMLQAEKRGYWFTDQENIDNLKKLYLDLESWVERKFE